MLDLVPLAGAGRVVAYFNGQARCVGQLLQGPAQESCSRTVAAPTVGRNQQARRARMPFLSKSLPPSTDGGDGKLGCIMTDADGHAGFIVRDVVDSVRGQIPAHARRQPISV